MSQQDSPQTEQAAHSSGRSSPLAAIVRIPAQLVH
jgi:hypothetical protein